MLFGIARAIEQKDKATSGHCERLGAISLALGTALNLPRAHLRALYCGAFLHDIGKIGVPDAILFKKGPLTPREWAVMRMHTVTGEEICRPARSLCAVLPIIRSHHERWDGSGYPDGLAGEQIPLLARILQVADIFDALISARPYKPPMAPGDALAVLEDEACRGWRDRALVYLLKDVCTNSGFGDLLTPVPMGGQPESLENMRRALLAAQGGGGPVKRADFPCGGTGAPESGLPARTEF